MNSKNLKKGKISKKSLPFIAVSVASVGFALSTQVKAADVDIKEDVVATETSEVKAAEVKEAVIEEVRDENTLANSAKLEVLPEVDVVAKTSKVEAPASDDLQLKSEVAFTATTQENEPTAQAEDVVLGEEFTVDNLNYRFVDKNAIDKTVKFTGCDESNKPTGNFTVPGEITHESVSYKVEAIAANALKDCVDIESITLPESIKEIGSYAFGNCSKLATINFPAALKDLGETAFYGCEALIKAKIPQGITEIKDGTFNGCAKLSEVQIPEDVKTIGPNAFNECAKLTKIKIPASVTTIGNNAFKGCTNLKYMIIEGKNVTLGTDALSNTFIGDGNEGAVLYLHKELKESADFKEKLGLTSELEEKILKEIPSEAPSIQNIRHEINGDKLTISWDAAKNANRYKITLKVNGENEEILEKELTATEYKTSLPEDKSKSYTYSVIPYIFYNPDAKQEDEYGKMTLEGEAKEVHYGKSETKNEYPELKHVDSKTGVILEASEGTFPEGSQVVVEEVEKDHANYALVWNDLDDDIKEVAERFKFYSIEVRDKDGNKVQPQNGNKVKICLPIPEGYDIKDLEAFKIESREDVHYKSKIELIDGKNYLVFEVDHFCYYGIIDSDMKKVEEITSKNEQNNSNSSSNSDKSGEAGSKGSSSKSKESGSSGFYKTSDGRLSSILGCIFSSISSGVAYLFSRKSRKRR